MLNKDTDNTSASNTFNNIGHNTACNTIMEFDSEDTLTESTSNLFVSRLETDHQPPDEISFKRGFKNSVSRYSIE